MSRPLITETDIRLWVKQGRKTIMISPNTLITPLAHECAKKFKIEFTISELHKEIKTTEHLHEFEGKPVDLRTQPMIAIGSDHSGFQAKAVLKNFLTELHHPLVDVGTNSIERCDYPDFALKVGEELLAHRAQIGIMIDGIGTASAVVLNKIPGVRAASCGDEFTAKIARAHGNANALSLGAGSIGIEKMKSIVTTFLQTAFEGDRHASRLAKISAIETRFSRPFLP